MTNNRFFYNIKGIARMLTPSFCLPKNREKILRDLDSRKDLDYIKNRVDYYCQMREKTTLDSDAKSLDFLRWTHKQTVYFFDCYEYAQYFPQDFKAHFEFGDVNYIPQKPSLAKSRPILEYYEQTLSHHCKETNQTNQSATTSSLRESRSDSKQSTHDSSLRGNGNATTKQSTLDSSLRVSETNEAIHESTNPKIDCHDFATQNLAMTRWADSSLRESRSDSKQSTKNTNGGGRMS